MTAITFPTSPIQAIDPNATTIEEVQTNASASTGAENQSWSDG